MVFVVLTVICPIYGQQPTPDSAFIPPPSENFEADIFEFNNPAVRGSVVLLDQYGGGLSDWTGNATLSQDFEANWNDYDVAAVDNFSVSESCKIVQIVCGLRTLGGCEYQNISAFRVNIHDNIESAESSIYGNVASLYVDAADTTIIELATNQYMLYMNEAITNAPLSTLPTLSPGEYWFSIV